MEWVRQRIERQVLSLTGLGLKGVDFEKPLGDPGLFGPQSVSWRVHGDFTSMLIGGITALMLQMLHPAALAGVWDHSNFRADLIGRLRRTGQFIAGTTFGGIDDAERLIQRVRDIHANIVGTTAYGEPYSANDPYLLTWVHVAEVSSFLAAHLRYKNPMLSVEQQDRYYAEIALVAERLGARDVPKCRAEIVAFIDNIRPELRFDKRTQEVLDVLFNAPAPSALAKPVGSLMMRAGVDLLPDWARRQLQLKVSGTESMAIQAGVRRIAPVLRWAVQNGSSHRAHRRLGLAPP
ncbi:oxygenase MpaB family protein [Pseudomonas sp. Marseille-QA0892]